jgi:hypothetical protein
MGLYCADACVPHGAWWVTGGLTTAQSEPASARLPCGGTPTCDLRQYDHYYWLG